MTNTSTCINKAYNHLSQKYHNMPMEILVLALDKYKNVTELKR